MIAKNNLIVLIFLIILNFILSKSQDSNLQAPINGTDFPDIKCGRDQPKKKNIVQNMEQIVENHYMFYMNI